MERSETTMERMAGFQERIEATLSSLTTGQERIEKVLEKISQKLSILFSVLKVDRDPYMQPGGLDDLNNPSLVTSSL
ncbi:MAG: hypothetical protein WA130_10145 [Candidatus Methanoperedens sp.]